MADVRCPMCSKPNPEELEICQFCGARLKPLSASTADTPPDSSAGLPDGLSGPGQPVSADKEEIPDWLTSLRGDKNGTSAQASASSLEPASDLPDELPAGPGDTTDWMARLGGGPQVEGMPDQFSGQAEDLPGWLDQLKEKAIDSEPAPRDEEGTITGSGLPDWLANLGSVLETPEAVTRENVPGWLSDQDAKTTPESTAPESTFGNELLPSGTARADRSTTPANETPASITNDEGTPSGGKNDSAFPMEIPDWLSKLKPEQAAEKGQEGADEVTSGSENIEGSEMPSWVQAMRPVESVVAETKATQQEAAQVTEQSGPLAGLQGVLPVSPGLGPLRKPPVYSTLLQVTDGQQRYAAAFERLISSETQPRATKRTRLVSSRLWRWLIAGLLILAVALPLSARIPITPPSKLQPPEMLNAFNLIGSLPANMPVLVVFDYDPALSGELEAAAAPLMDHLLLQGPRLALISTNPTGPALAERFLHNTSASPLVAGHNYQAGQQYVNLGYLAGGPSGVLYFANAPAQAAPFTMDGQQAWQLPPLQGIQKLSDFAAMIVLTDNADSGRVWIEQAGSAIGNTPMLMVISAQAEPLILPYYDSGQIKGLVTGLAGGEAYEQTFIRPDAQAGLAYRYWNSFSAGTFVAEILIIVGVLLSAVAGWRTRRDKSGEEA